MDDAAVTTVLVVDDNPATRYSTGRILKGAGFNVLEAATGHDAVAMSQMRPDVVVLDINLPDIDGFQVCRELRGQSETARTPVIHLSATFVTDFHKVQGLDSGADGYLTHPVEPLVLIATVNAFLRARRAEEEMRKSEAKYRAIFDQTQNGICLFSHDFELLEANPAMGQMLHRPREQLLGHRLHEWMFEADLPKLSSILQRLEDVGWWHGTFSLLDSRDHFVPVDWRMSVHSVPGVWLAMASDAAERLRVEVEREQLLTSERAARANAERANRLKDDFLATLSHELRTPLSAIVGWTHVLKFGEQISDADRAEGIEAIERNVKIQTQLIEDLLDISRIASGKIRLEIQDVDLASIALASLESVMPAVKAKGVEIIRDFDPDAGHIAADPSRLQQVIWNLVTNAVKFSQRGGKIYVRVRRLESSVEFSVTDEGQGISLDFLPYIFERFRQEDASSTRNFGGLGLGLAIVKNLVEMHGGTVEARSEGLEKGAQFIIRIPITAVRQPELAQGEKRSEAKRQFTTNYLSSGNIRGVKVLIVDDDPDTRILLTRLLEDCGAVVATAADVVQALHAIQHLRPDLLVSDIGMPDQNGYDFIRQVRQLGGQFATLPAIALTAFARPEDRHQALGASFQKHLGKPVDPGELVAAVASLSRSAVTSD